MEPLRQDYLEYLREKCKAKKPSSFPLLPSEIIELLDEIQRLKEGKFTEEELQNLCHNLPEGFRCRFYLGCEVYQQKLFGKGVVDHCIQIVEGFSQEIGKDWADRIVYQMKVLLGILPQPPVRNLSTLAWECNYDHPQRVF